MDSPVDSEYELCSPLLSTLQLGLGEPRQSLSLPTMKNAFNYRAGVLLKTGRY